MKNIKLFSVAITTILVLVGCQGNQEGMYDRNQNTGDNDVGLYDGNQNNMNNGTRDGNRNNMNNMNNGNQNRDGYGDKRNNNLYDDPSNRLNDGNRSRNDRMNDQNTRQINNRNNNNQNDRYDVAEKAADKITDEVDEIDYAYVLTTSNNAYVAAVLDNDNRTNKTRNRRGTRDNDNNTRNISDRNHNTNNDDTNRGGDLTDEVKSKITDIVKSVDKDIDNVYVTTNPDFADLSNDYINDVNDNRPVRGFFDQIGNMIERVFPQDKRK